jgi:outer membrane protein assembly factor BamB
MRALTRSLGRCCIVAASIAVALLSLCALPASATDFVPLYWGNGTVTGPAVHIPRYAIIVSGIRFTNNFDDSSSLVGLDASSGTQIWIRTLKCGTINYIDAVRTSSRDVLFVVCDRKYVGLNIFSGEEYWESSLDSAGLQGLVTAVPDGDPYSTGIPYVMIPGDTGSLGDRTGDVAWGYGYFPPSSAGASSSSAGSQSAGDDGVALMVNISTGHYIRNVFPCPGPINAAPGDQSRLEIVWTCPSEVVAYNGTTGSKLWAAPQHPPMGTMIAAQLHRAQRRALRPRPEHDAVLREPRRSASAANHNTSALHVHNRAARRRSDLLHSRPYRNCRGHRPHARRTTRQRDGGH